MYNTAHQSVLLLTTFGVLGIHARQHGPSSLIHTPLMWAFLAH
jgi:hypothetical protein